ncbi:UspA domain protein, partial [mine drainage metagenome]
MTPNDVNSVQKLKRVLVATDFSEEGNKAVKFAEALVCRDKESTLYIVNAIKPSYIPSSDDFGAAEYIIQENDDLIKNGKSMMESLVADIKKDGINNVQSVVILGDPETVIINAANEFKVGLIVLGTRKHGFKKGILLGSVSERVSANS